jgi:hypothetical protein
LVFLYAFLRRRGEKLKKILCLILICIFLVGCSNDVSDKSSEPQDEITYAYEDVDATITYIDMRKWFATCHRWQWEISVEYDGLTYEEDNFASGAMNRPSFADSQEGDSLRVRLTNKYVNGELADRYISEIR